MEAMESASRYPDLTRLGISAGAVVGPVLITTIRAKCAEMGARGGGGAGSRKADTINALGDTNSIYASGNSSQSQGGAGAPLSGSGGCSSWGTPAGAGGSGCVIFAISP